MQTDFFSQQIATVATTTTTKMFLKLWTSVTLIFFSLWPLGNLFFNICQTSYYVFRAGFRCNIACKHDVHKGKNGWEVKGN